MINPRNSHAPLPDEKRKRCPICRQTVYSSAGIHPQCAIKQADPWLPESPTEEPGAEMETKVEVKSAKRSPAVAPKPSPAPAARRKVKQAGA